MIDDTQDCRYCYKYWWTIWTFTKYIATIEQLGIFFPNFCLFAHNTQHIFHFPNTYTEHPDFQKEIAVK